MKMHFLPVLLIGALSGCTVNGIQLPKGMYLNKCVTSASVDYFRPASCMTPAEYRTARKKVKHSGSSAAAGREDEGERVEEVRPVDARSRIGISE